MKKERDMGNGNPTKAYLLIRRRLPYLVLVVLLALSAATWRFKRDVTRERDRRLFTELVDKVVTDITGRLERYKMILQGGAGIFLASAEVTRDEWRAYYEYRQIHITYPGIQGIGYATVVRPEELAWHIEQVRAEGFPDYTVRPAGEREVYTSIIFLEPFDAVNQRAFGYDMFSEPVRRQAMARTRDTGQVALSGRVTLVQNPDGDAQPGFLLYVPIYTRGMPLETVADRRAALQGFACAQFRTNDLMHGIFPDPIHEVDFVCYDGTEVSPSRLVYGSHISAVAPRAPMFSERRTLDLYGHQWTLDFETMPAFEAHTDWKASWIVLGGGVVISLLMFLLLKMLGSSADRAQALAEKMTEALRESERDKSLILENADEIMAYHDRDRRLVWANKKYLAGVRTATGLPATVEDVKGKNCFDAWGLDKKCNHCPVGEAIRTGTPQEAVLTPQNQPHWPATQGSWLIRAVPVRDSAGTIIGAIEMAHDITDRLRAEDDLRCSEERQRYILSASPTIIYTLRRDDFAATWVSPNVSALLGYTVEEALEPGWWERHLHPEDRERAIADAPSVLETGHIEFTYRFFKKDSTVCWINDCMDLKRDPGHSEEIIGAWNDITAHKQGEADRIARQAAEAANREKSRFLANMSHEIRTPMNAILGFAQIIGRDPDLDPVHAKQIHSINRAGHHLLALINDILDMAKIEAGMTELSPRAFSLHALLDDLQIMFRSRAEAKALQLIMERDPGVPLAVLADEAKLRQILVNLIGNAVKFTQEGGVAVRVRTEPAAAEAAGPGGESGRSVRLIVEVEDSGPGIPAADLERIFGAFVQGEVGGETGGTGLGLPISRKLVEMMGGSLTVQSEVGRGSCFRFDVLLEPTEALPEEKEPESRRMVVALVPGTGPWRILVVDDVQDNRELLCDLLQPVGFEICEARNGAEALAAFAEWSPHAVLMDMRMPVMDGYEATRRIKATEAGRNTPVIAVTASAFGESEEEIRRTGVSAYLRKPFHTTEIFEVLGKCLGLRYVYADEPDKTQERSKAPALTPESVAALPAGLRRAMREAVAEGDMARLAELIGQAQTIAPSVATRLHGLAERYDYERLDVLLANGGDDNG